MSNEGETKITGVIQEIGQPREISGKWRACDFVVTWDNGHKVQPIKLQTLSSIDKPNILDDWQAGDNVTVHCNLRGSESKTGAIYTNVVAWRIEGEKRQIKTGSRYAQTPASREPRVEDNYIPRGNQDDDIPF